MLFFSLVAGTVEGVSRNNILANDRVTNPRGKGLSPQYNYLLNDLKQFNMIRHHKTNPLGKGHAENYIRDTFSSLGLHTWTERFEVWVDYQSTKCLYDRFSRDIF